MERRRNLATPILGAVALLVVFLLLESYQYQLFHLVAEGFSIVVSATLFVLAANLYRTSGFGPLVFLGLVAGGVALTDFLHVIAFPPMGVFPGYDLNLAVSLWIIARVMESTAFALAFALWNRPRSWAFPAALVVLGVVWVVALVLIFAQQFPLMWHEGRGLTPAKVGLEYLCIALLALTGVRVWALRQRIVHYSPLWIVGALASAIAAEISFTLYWGPTDLANVVGHFFKVVTFYLLYRVFIRHSLVDPYDTVFHQLQDANERLETEVLQRTNDLQKSLTRFQVILDASPWPLLLIRSEPERPLQSTGGNPAARELFGALEGRTVAELLTSAGFTPATKLASQLSVYVERRYGDLPFEGDQGGGDARRTFDVTPYPVDTETWVIVFTDVTARRRVLEGYLLQNQIFQLSRDLIMVVDREGELRISNPAWRHLLAWNAFDLAAVSWLDLVHADDRLRAQQALASLGASSSSAGLEVRMLGDQDLVLTVSWNLQLSTDGRLVYGVGRDVTKDRATEALLLQASKHEGISLLAGGIAHDFNNMLAGMFGFVELARMHAQRGNLSAVESSLERSLRVFDRAKGLTRQLLAVSKGSKGLPVVLDLSTLLHQVCDFVLAGSSIEVVWDVETPLGPCEVDADQVFQAFQNLILNARQAMGETGRLEIRGRNREGQTWIEIQDSGPGIPPAVADQVFDPFMTTKPEGSGLGLAIVASIAAKHQGRVRLRPDRSPGACFELVFPQAMTPATVRSDETAPLRSHEALRVLVLEDDPDVQTTLRETLLTWGHQVTMTADGSDTVREARQALATMSPFQVAIIDWTIRGGVGGGDTVKALKLLDHELKVIVTTGYAANLPSMRGFDAVLAKPFRLDELRTHLST